MAFPIPFDVSTSTRDGLSVAVVGELTGAAAPLLAPVLSGLEDGVIAVDPPCGAS